MNNKVNYKRILNQPSDPGLDPRISILENNEYKVTYFESVSAATGAVTPPAQATILLDQFMSGVDAYVTTIVNGQPTGIFPQTSLGVTVDVTSFDAVGNYVLSGVPSAYPVAIIYILKIKAIYYGNLNINNILDLEETYAPPIAVITASGTNTYTASANPAWTVYTVNGLLYVLFTNANTTAATLNVNGLGAKAITSTGSIALTSGQIKAGQILSLVYDGTQFQIIGDGGSTGPAGSGIPIADATGTANAITATFTTPLTLTDKVTCAVVCTAATTITNPTFAPDGLTAHTIVLYDSIPLSIGAIPGVGFVAILEYNASTTSWILVNSFNAISNFVTLNSSVALFNYYNFQ